MPMIRSCFYSRMVRRFRHKGLKTLCQRDDASGVRALRLLASLDVAQTPRDWTAPVAV